MNTERDIIIDQRLKEFQHARVAHSHLEAALQEALFYILRSPSTAIINIVGPTGAGKSMLLNRLEAEIIKAKHKAMVNDPNMRPFVSTLAVASGHRQYDFKRLYAAILDEVGDCLAKGTLSSAAAASRRGASGAPSGFPWAGSRDPSTAALRERLERELRWRNTCVCCIDEAHHAVFHGKSGSPLSQLEVFKSIAQRGTTKLCLIGPPELEEQLLLSGQLARRSMTIHFSRYRHSNDDELHEFASVADKFMRLMALSGRPDVEENLDFLYNGTLGCIGILKDWLERAMAVALVRHEELDKVALTLADLRRTRMPANAILSVRSQIVRMERSMTFSETDVEHDQIVHGEAPVRGLSEALNGSRRSSTAAAKRTRVASGSVAAGTTTIVDEKTPKRRLKPGQRKPGRDLVSNSEMWGA